MAFTIAQVQDDSRTSNQFQSNISNALTLLSRNPVVGGILLTQVQLSAGDNTVSHKLGRQLQGWLIVRQRAQAQVYDKQDANTNPKATLTLNTSADVTLDLYVF